MNEEAALLAAICAEPTDDTPRLVYADWLQEHGQEDYAEFIRVECEIARLCDVYRNGTATAADVARQTALFEREGQLSRTVYPARIHPVFYWLTSLGIDYSYCVFNRGGFLDAVTCTAEQWFQHGDTIRARHPVTRVLLTQAWTEGLFQNRDGKRAWVRSLDEFLAFLRDTSPGVEFAMAGEVRER